MVAALIPLQVVQAASEVTRGTGIACTYKMDFTPGTAVLTRDPSIISIRQAGSMATRHRTYAGREIIQLEWSGPVTYNWLPNILNCVLGPLSTGTGAGADKLWAFTGTSNTIISDVGDNLKSMCFEVGGVDTWPQEYKLSGCVCTKFELSIKQDQPWTYKITWLGTLAAIGAKTGGLTPVASLQDVLGNTTKAYLDTSSGFGTTQVVGSVLSADITIDIGAVSRYTLDSLKSPYRVAVTSPRNITAKVILEHNATTDYTATFAATAQRLRIKSQGPVLGGTFWIAQFDIPGVWNTFTFGKDGDVITEELAYQAQYDSVAGMVADIGASVTTNSAALL